MSFLSPLLTWSYASSLRPMQFRISPFIASVSAEGIFVAGELNFQLHLFSSSIPSPYSSIPSSVPPLLPLPFSILCLSSSRLPFSRPLPPLTSPPSHLSPSLSSSLSCPLTSLSPFPPPLPLPTSLLLCPLSPNPHSSPIPAELTAVMTIPLQKLDPASGTHHATSTLTYLPPCSLNLGLERICRANFRPFLYCLHS